jgi:sulfite exporter TauE/SafE
MTYLSEVTLLIADLSQQELRVSITAFKESRGHGTCVGRSCAGYVVGVGKYLDPQVSQAKREIATHLAFNIGRIARMRTFLGSMSS